MLFALDECLKFFCVAHFGGAILVFFWAIRCCLLLLQHWLLVNHLRSSAFSPSSTGFCYFRNFHTWLSLIYQTSLSPFFLHKFMRFLILSFIPLTWWSLWAKGCQFYCLFLFKFGNTFRPRWMPELLFRCSFRCSHSRLLCTLLWCLLLLQLCLRFNHLCPSAFSPFSSGFCHFRNFHTCLSLIYHTSLSPFFLHKLMRFLILSFITLTWGSLWGKGCQSYSLCFYYLLFSVAHFDAAILLFSTRFAASTLPSVQPPTFVRFLGVVIFFFFSHFVVTYFWYVAVTF